MKLRTYIVVGYLVSMIITVIGVLGGLKQMLIDSRAIFYILLITFIASLTGGIVNMLLLSNVFSSLKKLKSKMQAISEKQFHQENSIRSPQEFRALEDSFNQMSENLEVSFESLNESEREKSIMIAQLSHDIKTPLTSIQATVEGILDGIIEKNEERHYLNTIARQINRLNQLTEELHLVSLNNCTEADIARHEQIYLETLLIDSLSEFQLTLERENRPVTIQVAPEVVKIRSQYEMLSRILLNLVSNAIKYSDSGTSLNIEAYQQSDEVYIDVIDQGKGIRDEDLNQIFKRLYRVESSRNMNTGGHGLGLYIARQLANQLGGDIVVTSEFEKGSCFSVHLPIENKTNK
ncbi:sensor histidine kinase [Streptococcus ruminantium]|uniref:histidine kinase n=1 Tax=Streptococcus ruminantium TaxID=1917441 RepID=A0ABU1B5T4_9STRE|nr:HAMP domain-containing sensor histidine kinase [Streptococcus ruminantium]MDQ8759401.1 HAMP domain-containing sensor histidine kinase [Streptococcus ruminantium]MDQ8769736.1 HAMP domain-containing sensor histidine kinase [Streptococcus ruminantium]MDQ8774472.1 HAMP domain-containing sensor histidine kinase [Streptococcus ruminantium]MDQ8794465.1 HAMP domain-containing sensor histidine kinase [Streptococcus ruminantium]MDQ8795878.1 HAMP domain-containing sensor histidine kinase [Streptococcu